MRIGIYATPAVRDRGGVGWYVYYLLRGLVRLTDDFELVCYVDRGSFHPDKLDAWAVDPRVRWCETPRWAIKYLAQRDRLDLYHGTNFRLQTVGRHGGLVTIYDGWLDRHPEYSTRVFGQRSAASRTRRAVWRARRVLTISKFSAREITELYGLPPERIEVVYCGISEEFRPLRDPAAVASLREKLKLSPDEGFVLFVGGADPRKNHRMFLQAAGEQVARLGRRKLVLVGDPVHRFGNYLESARAVGLADRVICPGRVSGAELRLLYSHADLFVFPSLYEGFGMPVLEAMACGAPVVTSDRSSLPEVAGDAALLVNPEDPAQLGQAMVQVLEDRALRDTLIAKGFERTTLFSWEDAARQVMRVYQELCSQSRASGFCSSGGTATHSGQLAEAPPSQPLLEPDRAVGPVLIPRPISVRNILLLKLRYIGDVLLATPIVRALRQAFPDSQLTVAVYPGTEDVLRHNPDVAEVLLVDRSRFGSQAYFYHEVRKRGFDCVIDLTGNDRAEFTCLLSRIPIRIGFREPRRWRGWLAYTHEVASLPEGTHRISRDMALLAPLGITSKPEPPMVWLTAEEEEQGRRTLQEFGILRDGRPLIMFHPGARYWFKAWPAERFAQLADRLASEAGCRVLIGGGPSEKAAAAEIQDRSHRRPINLTGLVNLRQFAAIVKRCALYIGNDNGSMHLAAAVGTPVLGLFGPSSPAEWAPYGTAEVATLYKGLDCRLCYHPTCTRGEQSCMRQITVDEVFEAARRLLPVQTSQVQSIMVREQENWA
ncbi:MAG: putative lipopolysaccharide heptosyltransferase III [Nitrospiraceae bacterium]